MALAPLVPIGNSKIQSIIAPGAISASGGNTVIYSGIAGTVTLPSGIKGMRFEVFNINDPATNPTYFANVDASGSETINLSTGIVPIPPGGSAVFTCTANGAWRVLSADYPPKGVIFSNRQSVSIASGANLDVNIPLVGNGVNSIIFSIAIGQIYINSGVAPSASGQVATAIRDHLGSPLDSGYTYKDTGAVWATTGNHAGPSTLSAVAAAFTGARTYVGRITNNFSQQLSTNFVITAQWGP